TLWEEATRVPLIIDAPQLSPGVCDAPVSLLDLFPTLLELCNFDDAPILDGISLVPLIENPNSNWNRPAVIEYKRGNAAVRDARYRYIQYADGSEELYDHQSDPNEWHNLVSEAGVHTIKQRLSTWIPKVWAASAEKKNSFKFDPQTFRWTHKTTGVVTEGQHAEP
ncbi:MAG: sulfatase/phosphatase domain-containing protein, partial [Rubripirellula sp.]